MLVERLRAAVNAAERLSPDQQEQVAQSIETLLDDLQWAVFFTTESGQTLLTQVAEDGQRNLATGNHEEIKDDWGK